MECTSRAHKKQKPFHRRLIFQMSMAVIAGFLVGRLDPSFGAALNILPTAFLKVVRLVVGPLIFVMITLGVAKVTDLRKVGRLALLTLIYFEGVTTLAFIWGALITNWIRPGDGLHLSPTAFATGSVSGIITRVQEAHTTSELLLSFLPSTIVSPFLDNNVIQVIIVALLTGCAITHLGAYQKSVIVCLSVVERIVFIVIGFIMRLAPLAVAGAVANVVGSFGFATILSLAKLVGTIYFDCLSFVAVVFVLVALISKVKLSKLIRYIREELLLAFTTASSEAALPRLLIKVRNAGVPESTAAFVLPAGYSFNLDGGSMYLITAALFIAQAFDVPLTFSDQIAFVGIFALTSKGLAGIPGGAVIILASSLLMMPQLPLVGVSLLLSIDRIVDPIKTATNVLGNALAALVVARWAKVRDDAQMKRAFDGEPIPDDAAVTA